MRTMTLERAREFAEAWNQQGNLDHIANFSLRTASFTHPSAGETSAKVTPGGTKSGEVPARSSSASREADLRTLMSGCPTPWLFWNGSSWCLMQRDTLRGRAAAMCLSPGMV